MIILNEGLRKIPTTTGKPGSEDAIFVYHQHSTPESDKDEFNEALRTYEGDSTVITLPEGNFRVIDVKYLNDSEHELVNGQSGTNQARDVILYPTS